jgi:hypothetical protein
MDANHGQAASKNPRGLRRLPRQHPPQEAYRVNGIVTGEPGDRKRSRRVVCPANDYVEQAMHRRVFCLLRAKSRLASLNITIARRAMQLAGRMVDSGRSASLRRDGNDRVTSAGKPVHVRGYEVQRHVVPTSPRRRSCRRPSDEESASIDPRRPIMLSISQLQMARSRQNLAP